MAMGGSNSNVLLRTSAGGVISCGHGRQQFKALLRTKAGGVPSCGNWMQQVEVLLRTDATVVPVLGVLGDNSWRCDQTAKQCSQWPGHVGAQAALQEKLPHVER